ncbi:bifunctional DNA-formamidopyrimidine glycosylase/DNA-(apurinic or apyrimidinic site) lyase [Gammaproteobacteria bacterium]|nr:bifunctional DNA-formamidopyrimidine glycosylase/DNA-(apurinic or apyrimidinic site) lyase [Gammaproteobacteria bacterium]MDC1325713.1 bifunctional DNA-formamidopyrimidine glycosylase/DNA-(apurinic or apyrimidinic site) lyase [Gammaproteobacteria bacterium]
MPELPEVETSVRAIQRFKNNILESVEIHNSNLRWPVDLKAFKNLKNVAVDQISRRAKYILFHIDDSQILLHLGMTGTVRIAEKESNFYKKHDHVEFIFQDAKLIYNDPRRFGSLHFVPDPQHHFLLDKLGPEPLSEDFDGDYLFKKLRKVNSPIKVSLMNQSHVAGIGNIYANEILFDVGVRPTKRSRLITKKQSVAIAESAKKILQRAIEVGGTTLKDFYQPDGNQGYFKIELAAYDREGQECTRCGTGIIQRIVQTQRASFFCSKCQS